MDGIILAKDFDPKFLTFHDVVKSKKNGGKIMGVSYQGKRLRIQTEEMSVPFGLNQFKDEVTNTTSTSIVCSFTNFDSNPKMKAFLDIFKAFDDKLLETVVASSHEIMGKHMQTEVLKEFYRPTVKPPSDPKYSPLLKVKVAAITQAGQMPRVFNKDKTKAEIEDITKGSSVKLIIDIPYVYFINKNFGATVKLFQACITKSGKNKIGRAHV